jgi:beta-lactamase class D
MNEVSQFKTWMRNSLTWMRNIADEEFKKENWREILKMKSSINKNLKLNGEHQQYSRSWRKKNIKDKTQGWGIVTFR